jgi:exopolysaccharide production protein ExoQ
MHVFSIPLSAPRHRLTDWLRRVAALCLALMPLIVVVADRVGPLLVTLAAAAALAATAIEGRARGLMAEAVRRLGTPLGVASLGFLAWAALSIAWSPAKATAFHAFGELLLPIAAAYILVLAIPPCLSAQAGWLLGVSAGLAAVLIGLELRTGVGARGALGLRTYPFLFNRPTLTLLVLLAPILALALRLRPKGVAVAGACAAAAFVAGAVFCSYSGAAKLGLLTGVAVYAAARLSARLALASVALGLAAVFALAHVWGDIADRVLPASLHARLEAAHSRDRVDIWQSFGAAIREQPVVGAGFGSSARFTQAPVAARVASEYRPFLDIGHPHNAAIQVWAELGVVGAVLGLLVLLLGLRSLASSDPDRLAPRLGLFAAVVGISLIGHGAWQGWWAAAIGAAVVWFRFGERGPGAGRSAAEPAVPQGGRGA